MSTALLLLALVFAFNVVVDPTAVFNTGWLEPVVWTARREKLELFRRATFSPKTILLGSSRAMKVPTEDLEEVFGGPAFNFAVGSARAEDFSGIYSYVRTTGAVPETLVIAVDIESFHTTVPVHRRLVAVPELRSSVPKIAQLRVRLTNLTAAMSWATLRLSVRAIARGDRRRAIRFNESGFLTYVEREARVAAGRYDLDAEVQKSIRQCRAGFAGFTELASWRVQQLRDLVSTAVHDGASVVLYITPTHPQVLAELRKVVDFDRLHRELSRELDLLARRPGVCAFDAAEIRAFGGSASLFYDGVHPREENNVRLIAAIANGGRCAIQ